MLKPFVLACALLSPVMAEAGELSITVSNDLRCIASDGLPDHETGAFPNPGNPHTIMAQTVMFCVDATPELGDTPQEVRTTGIAINGVLIRPGTADWYDASSPRGHSRDRSSGWRLDGLGAAETLGMDSENAHVDNRGRYHYHGVSPSVADAPGTLVGWAADGFEIHYVGEAAVSSWQLKEGERPTAPGSAYDGTYVQDWHYVEGSGTLDACNGAVVDGRYVYFATDTFPFFPHCLMGDEIMEYRG